MHIFPFGDPLFGLGSQESPPVVGMRLVHVVFVLNEIYLFTGFKRVLAETLLNIP